MPMSVDTFFSLSKAPGIAEPSHTMSKSHHSVIIEALTWEEFEVLYGLPNERGGEENEDSENS
jgi:hypothetical protein